MPLILATTDKTTGQVVYLAEDRDRGRLVALEHVRDFLKRKHREINMVKLKQVKQAGENGQVAGRPTERPTAPEKTGGRIVLPNLNVRVIRIRVIGDSPLITHAWNEKAQKEMLDKQMGVATAGRKHKDPDADYEAAAYVIAPPPPGGAFEDSTFGAPAVAFKCAAVTACTSLGKTITKVAARQAFHVFGQVDGAPSNLVPIDGRPTKRMDMVRIGMGTADMRFRPEFFPWACDLVIRYNANVLSDEQLLNLINVAGFAVGVCEWRPEKNGQFGLFHVE